MSMVISGRPHISNGGCMPSFQQTCQHRIKISRTAEKQPIHSCDCEPIIELPPSPEHEYEEVADELEGSHRDDPCDLEDIVPGVQYDAEIDLTSSKFMMNNHSCPPNNGKDLVLMNPQCSFVRNKKLKNIGRLRTEHNAYVINFLNICEISFSEISSFLGFHNCFCRYVLLDDHLIIDGVRYILRFLSFSLGIYFSDIN
jgi:hypothetical protein